MTRLWAKGVPIDVTLHEGVPARLVWAGRVHPVAGVADRWRVDVSWWRERRWRDYYKLHTTTGLLVIVYHDLVNDRWFLQRIYD